MKWRFLVLLFLLPPLSSYAYSLNAHTTLTKEIVSFYNKHYPDNKISGDLVDFLVDGARKEDDPFRYLNHFYDPLNDRGLTIGLKNWTSAKNWAQSSKSQLAFKYLPLEASILSAGEKEKIKPNFSNKDFTWQNAINYWQRGEREMAMYVLGHVLHLLEDVAVPEHTRNDPHPYESTYENFTDKARVRNDFLGSKKPIILKSLTTYFDAMALYSNNNFFSVDSMNDYKNPKPDYFKNENKFKIGIRKDNEFGDYRVIKFGSLPWVGLSGSIDDKKILQDYWDRLSTKAVQNGAGVLHLFFEEANKRTSSSGGPSLLANLVDSVVASVQGDDDDLKEVAVVSLENNAAPLKQEPIKEVKAIKTEEVLAIVCSYNSSSASTHKNALINEIAWMGSVSDSNNEWIELKNISGDTLNISDWWLIDKDEQIKFNFPKESMVSRNGFYLLERTDDQSVPLVAADFIFKGSISNENEGLRLFDSNCNLIDEVLAQPNWLAGISSERKTMERESNLNWHDGPVDGTPKMENSQPVIVAGSGSAGGGVAVSAPTVPVVPITTTSVVTTTSTTTTVMPEQILKVFISEFLFDAEGSDDGKEFIELYNPNDQAVDISGWSIQVASSSGSISKKNFEAGNKIDPKSFFLIWLGSGGANVGMYWTSGSLNNTSGAIYLVKDQNKVDNGSDPEIVDLANYDKNTLSGFAPGNSLKRKDNIGEFQLNGATGTSAGFLKEVNFHNNYIDLIFDQYPFVPDTKTFWKVLVFYLNSEPLTQEYIDTDGNWMPNSNNLLSVQYPMYYGEGSPRYSVILPDTPERFGTGGGLNNVAYNYNSIEPNKIKIKTNYNATSTDYVTVAYYDFSSSGGGSQNFQLKLADFTKYYFRE